MTYNTAHVSSCVSYKSYETYKAYGIKKTAYENHRFVGKVIKKQEKLEKILNKQFTQCHSYNDTVVGLNAEAEISMPDFAFPYNGKEIAIWEHSPLLELIPQKEVK